MYIRSIRLGFFETDKPSAFLVLLVYNIQLSVILFWMVKLHAFQITFLTVHPHTPAYVPPRH